MLGKEIIMRELAAIDVEAACANDVFEQMAPKFEALGYVKPTYLEAIKTRESNYPTGLEVEPAPIAIPHAEAEHIIKPFVAPIRFKDPVPWGDMSDQGETVYPVKFAFMLGFKDPGEHIDLLQILLYNFQKEEWINQLLAAKNLDEFFHTVMELEWKHE